MLILLLLVVVWIAPAFWPAPIVAYVVPDRVRS